MSSEGSIGGETFRKDRSNKMDTSPSRPRACMLERGLANNIRVGWCWCGCCLLRVDDNDLLVNQILDGISEGVAFVRRMFGSSMEIAE